MSTLHLVLRLLGGMQTCCPSTQPPRPPGFFSLSAVEGFLGKRELLQMMRKSPQQQDATSRLVYLHDLHAMLCDSATQIFSAILSHSDNQHACHAPPGLFDAYANTHCESDPIVHAVACHASSELFDAYDDTHGESDPIVHAVAAAQAIATRDRYNCEVANSFDLLERDDIDATSDDCNLENCNSQDLANTCVNDFNSQNSVLGAGHASPAVTDFSYETLRQLDDFVH
eukprot:10035074-Karenia_brevis.AAC.1